MESPAGNEITALVMTTEHRRKWEETVSMMTLTAPGFLHLLYKKLSAEGNPAIPTNYVPMLSVKVPIAATDGETIIFNPDTYFDWKLPHRVFVLGHEIIHNMYGDVEMLHACVTSKCVLMPDGRKLDFDNDCMQRAMDARINASLIDSGIGSKPDDGWFDAEVKGGDSVYPIYERYLKKKQNEGKKPGNQPGNKPGQGGGTSTTQLPPGSKPPAGQPKKSFDELLKPGQASGKNPHEAAQARSPEQWAVEIKVAEQLESTRTQGNLPESMQRLFKQLLEPEVSWIDYIETLVKRQMGDGSIDWTTPHQWLGSTDVAGEDYFVPSDTGSGAGWIVVWGDTSGSIGDKELAKNIAELSGVIDQVRPQRLTLIWCDAGLRDGSVNELDEGSDLQNLKPVGGGGTDYRPVLDWIAKNNRGEQPDVFIGFTDGYVTFAKDGHPFPTIWASSTDVKYPFGQVVRINNIRRGA
jgi:predicted metal-dependent peptidase